MSQVPPPPTPQYPPPAYVAPEPKGKGLAVLALVLGLCGLIPFLGWLTGFGAIVVGIIVLATGRPGKGMAIGGMVAGVVLPILMAGAGMAIFFNLASGKANEVRCISNLRNIGSAVSMYRAENGDKWPQDLQVLQNSQQLGYNSLRCPSAPKGSQNDYFYFAPPTAGVEAGASSSVVACDHKGNHRDGRNVLFEDGSVRKLSESEFQAELAKPHNAAFAAALRAAEGP